MRNFKKNYIKLLVIISLVFIGMASTSCTKESIQYNITVTIETYDIINPLWNDADISICRKDGCKPIETYRIDTEILTLNYVVTSGESISISLDSQYKGNMKVTIESSDGQIATATNLETDDNNEFFGHCKMTFE